MYHKKSVLPYILIAPAVLILILYSYLPLPYGIFLSVNRVTPGTGELKFSGFENYRMLFVDPYFWESLSTTLYYALISTVAMVFIGTIISLILNSKIKGTSTYMTIMFIPWVISDVVAGTTWTWLFNPDFGVLNYIFSPFGIKASDILNKPKYAIYAVVIVSVWKMLSYSTLLLLAGLQNVSNDLIEASKLDGCSGFATFRYITFPIFSPTVLVVTLLNLINCINQSGIILVLTDGGPLRSTETLALYLYKEAFTNFHLTNAASLSIVLAAMNMIIVAIYLYVSKKNRMVIS